MFQQYVIFNNVSAPLLKQKGLGDSLKPLLQSTSSSVYKLILSQCTMYIIYVSLVHYEYHQLFYILSYIPSASSIYI